ncbi:hypothetical protein PT974_00616 [Cladobotryum mycophilum]|uniref:Pentatricopeptide repeat-containing protein-mitochondrial domain-containing protein n=1 Tax=Cladobotryum mycophilum TaxID=491253 RepID=A0ABR0T1J9_9HYPO
MQRSQLLYDGLWRCLCPAFDRFSLLRAAQRHSLVLHPLHRPAKRRRITDADSIQNSRQYGTEAVSAAAATKRQWNHLPPNRPHTEQDDGQAKKGTWDQRLLTPTPPNEATLKASSVDDIITALVALRDARKWKPNSQTIDQHQRIIQLVQHLVAFRGQPPSLFIYECMADAMADPQGSVDGLRRLLDDMATQGMKPTATFCRSALEALMNHPEYVFRQEILDIMQEYWFTVDAPAKQSHIIGLLRDEQYELAYTRLTDMIQKGARIDPWVYDIFILVFGKLGFLDEMLALLYHRKGIKTDDAIVDSLLYYVLDVCSRAYHHTGTTFAWNAVVRNSRLQPSDGIVENVVATAARNGDAQLATEAFELLSGRTRTQEHHYEAVVDAFAASGDLPAAFHILGIMKQNGIRVSRVQMGSIRKALKERPDLIRGQSWRPEKWPAKKDEKAMDLYRDVPSLCNGELPNSGMIQDLVIHSTDPSTSQILLKEYAERFSEKDDPARGPTTYGALITASAAVGEMDLAFRFAKQAMGAGVTKWHMKWIKALVEKAVESEDGRIWPIVDELSQGGDDELSKMVKKMLQRERIAKLAAEWREKTGRR